MNSFITNWKTTLIGITIAGLQLAANGSNWKQILIAVGTAALGVLAKDFNVSGK